MREREATFTGEPHEACVEPPMEPATYKHQPLSRSLDEIRLLKLRKEKHGPVHCEVEVFPLEQAPEYIALSYRWGPPSPSHDIFIGDQRLKIRDILHACLLELREDVDTWLWIDQICIAQADTAERNHQVGMMSRIYSTGASVIIWLGDMPLPGPGEVDRFNDQYLDVSGAELLENTYFARLWIVQEILLAKKVRICINGKRCITWSKMQAARPSFNSALSLQINPAPLFLLELTRGEPNDSRYMPLIDCIRSFSDSACEDLRDKVYGLIGVMRVKDRVTVDYNKTVLEVYVDVINVAVRKGTISSFRRDPVFYLCDLGSQMQLGESLMKGIRPLLKDRFGKMAQAAVNAVGFDKANGVQEHDSWWCEYYGEKSFYR